VEGTSVDLETVAGIARRSFADTLARSLGDSRQQAHRSSLGHQRESFSRRSDDATQS
jgi:hypothetical protein